MQANLIIQTAVFVSLMLYAAVMDIRTREIEPFVWISLMLIGVLNLNIINLFGILAALPFFIAACINPKSMGGGDIKFIASVGAILGFELTNYGIIIGLTMHILVVLAYAFVKNIKKQEVKKFSLPLAPCLSFGFLIMYFIKLGGRLL